MVRAYSTMELITVLISSVPFRWMDTYISGYFEPLPKSRQLRNCVSFFYRVLTSINRTESMCLYRVVDIGLVQFKTCPAVGTAALLPLLFFAISCMKAPGYVAALTIMSTRSLAAFVISPLRKLAGKLAAALVMSRRFLLAPSWATGAAATRATREEMMMNFMVMELKV